GIEFSYLTIDSYRPLFYLNDAQLNTEKTSVSKTIERDFKWQWENTLSYSRKIGDHNFSALIGTSASKYNFENLYGFNAGAIIIDPEQGYLNMATDTAWKATGGAYEETWLSGFARITYDYQNRYSLTAIFRRDGSSKFGANNRFGNFPSIGVSWIISEEKFFPVINNLDLVKIRATYGINGNDRIGNYSFLSTIDKSRGYIFGGGYVFGASPAYIENEGIHWEATGQWDIAIDLGLFNNRLIATFDFYTKNTEGLLERIPIPAHVGNDPPYSNVGSVSNKGLEMSLNWRNNGKTLNYAVGLNAAFNVNKMTKIGNTTGIIDGADWAVAGTVTRSEVGYPIAYFYGYKTDGIFQNLAEVYQHIGSTGEVLQPNAQPGDVRFVDVNDDGELNEKDLTMIGSPTPDWNFGFTANFDYKNFDLGFLITGTYGNEIFNGMFRNDLRMTNLPASILDRWTGEGTSNSTPRFTWTDTNNNNRISDLYIEDGSYARLKNIQIGYNLPKNFLESIHVSKWRIYISAENLYTLTNYTGADPEIGALNSFDIAIDRGIYPQARTFRLGTTVTF
ncbi:MAG: SusC/RagA family TonB-linked outer membrane protein, partial [Bacteroidales bacterium]|nr:SusC/RagA family TonB-linked outer membrane protein [Bacteroidales bacterium]